MFRRYKICKKRKLIYRRIIDNKKKNVIFLKDHLWKLLKNMTNKQKMLLNRNI